MGGGCAETVCVAQKRNCFEFKIHTHSRSTHHTHIQPARLIKKVKKKRKGKKQKKKSKKTKKKKHVSQLSSYARGERGEERSRQKLSYHSHTHAHQHSHMPSPAQPAQFQPSNCNKQGQAFATERPPMATTDSIPPHGRLPLVSIICPE